MQVGRDKAMKATRLALVRGKAVWCLMAQEQADAHVTIFVR